MKFFGEILMQSSEYFTFIAGFLGIILFFSMLFSLDFLKKLGKFFNRSYSTKQIEKAINAQVNIENVFFNKPLIWGILISLGAIWVTVFLLWQLDIERVVAYIKIRSTFKPLVQILFQVFQIVGVVGILSALVFGLLMIFNISLAHKISGKLNSWYNTEPLATKLDDTVVKDIDAICFLRNVIIGWPGLVISLVLIVLAVLNLLSS